MILDESYFRYNVDHNTCHVTPSEQLSVSDIATIHPHDQQAPRLDERVRRTRRRLTEALIELSADRPLEAITVRELTGRAGVGYATFFRHYGSIEALLRGSVDDMHAEMMALLPPLTGDSPARAGAIVFEHAAQHPGMYRLLLKADRSLGLATKIMEVSATSLLQIFESRPDARIPANVAADHFIASFLHLIEWWLDHDRPYPPDRMGQIYEQLILAPIEATALRRRPD